jgi:hypothetical protein
VHQDTRDGKCVKPSLRLPGGAEGPDVIGRESDLLRIDWLDLLLISRQSDRNRWWSLIGQGTLHHLSSSLIGREARFGGIRG